MTIPLEILATGVVVIGVCVASIVLAVVVLLRSRRVGEFKVFGRPVPRPRLWASMMLCLGMAGLSLIGRELAIRGGVMPDGWQQPSLLVGGVFWVGSFVLALGHAFSRGTR